MNAEPADTPEEAQAVKMSRESRQLRKALDAELQESGLDLGKSLVWSAAEEAIIAQILAETDRKSELSRLWDGAESTADKVKISAELRLLEGSIARQLRQVKTDVPAPDSLTTTKAKHAARSRWSTSA